MRNKVEEENELLQELIEGIEQIRQGKSKPFK
nr:hypothetical protein [uncultured archaeon]